MCVIRSYRGHLVKGWLPVINLNDWLRIFHRWALKCTNLHHYKNITTRKRKIHCGGHYTYVKNEWVYSPQFPAVCSDNLGQLFQCLLPLAVRKPRESSKGHHPSWHTKRERVQSLIWSTQEFIPTSAALQLKKKTYCDSNSLILNLASFCFCFFLVCFFF